MGPTASIKQLVEGVTQLVNDPNLQGDAHRDERRREIMSTIKKRVDFREMSKRVLGRAWRGINEAEKEHFTEIMTKLLEYIYIGRLEGFHFKKIDYLDERIEGNRAQVSTLIEKKKVNFPVYYLLQQTPKGWMVYDINVEGISLVQNYAEQFRSILRTNSFQDLVKTIEEKDKKLAETSQKS
jgi:phospholipid transport system substrate-binding protein